MRAKTRLLIIIGVIIAFLPYLGIPPFWKRALTSVAGILVVALAFLLRLGISSLWAKLRSLPSKEEQPAAAVPEHTYNHNEYTS